MDWVLISTVMSCKGVARFLVLYHGENEESKTKVVLNPEALPRMGSAMRNPNTDAFQTVESMCFFAPNGAQNDTVGKACHPKPVDGRHTTVARTHR
jgi:hypothetical protein